MIFLIACFSALGGLLFGYDLALIGTAIVSLKHELQLSNWQQEIVVGAAKLGAVLGTLVGGTCMLCYGRVKAIGVSSLFFMIGPLLMAASQGIWGLVLGRFVAGLGIGSSSVVVPAYLGEMATAKHRGAVVEVYEVALCLGMFMSFFIDYGLRGVPGDWRWMVGLPTFPGMMMALSTFILPESPRWLVLNGYPVDHRSVTEAQLAEIEHEVRVVQEQRAEGLSGYATGPAPVLRTTSNGSPMRKWSMIWKGPTTAREQQDTDPTTDTTSLLDPDANGSIVNMEQAAAAAAPSPPRPGFFPSFIKMMNSIWQVARGPEQAPFVIALILAFFNQANGSSSVIMYTPTVLAQYDPRLKKAIILSSLVGVTKLAGVLAGMFTVDHLGRRPLLILGSVGCGVALVGSTIAQAAGSMAGILISFCAFILSFSCSWAGGFWVLLSELFSLDAKSPAASAATAFLFLTGCVTDMLFLTMIDLMGAYAYLVFAASCFLAAVFVWWALPETKGRTLLEVQAMLASRRNRFRKINTSDQDLPSL